MTLFVKSGLIVLLSLAPIFGQASPSDFISIVGRFAVSLPSSYTNYQTFVGNEIGGHKFSGSTYTWQLAQDQVRITYGTTSAVLEKPSNRAIFLTTARDYFLKKTPSGSLVGEKNTTLDGHPGFIFVVQSDTGRVMHWIYLVGQRAYFLSLSLNDVDTIENNVKSVSTFRMATFAEIESSNAKLIEQLSPEPLALEARGVKIPVDAQIFGLKGKVKTISTDTETFVDGDLTGFRSRTIDHVFNEAGDLTKVVSYDGYMPSAVRAYGFIKGERIYKERRKERVPMSASTKQTMPEPDTIKNEIVKINYTLANNGQLSEMRLVDENGKELERSLFGVNKIERLYNPVIGIPFLSKLGDFNKVKDESLLDASGNAIELTRTQRDFPDTEYRTFDGKTEQIVRDRTMTRKYKYQYEFDIVGNWIKRTMIMVKNEKNQSVEVPIDVTYRTFKYY